MARRTRKSRADNRRWEQMIAALRLMNFAFNNIKIYPPTHTEVVGVIQKLYETLLPIFEEQEDVGFGFMDELLYIEGAVSIDETANNQMLVDRFNRCRIKYLTLMKGVSVEDLTNFFKVLNEAALKGSRDNPAELIEKAGVKTIHIVEAEVDDLASKSKTARKKTLFDWYLKAIETLKTAQEQLRDNPDADLKPLYRLIDDLMATVRSKGADPFLVLPALARGQDAHLAHSVNTAILSCALGDLHGLNSGQINTLCAAAFLHDLGRMTIPIEWTQDTSALAPEERETARQHCDWGFMLLLRQRQLSPQLALFAADHHHTTGGEEPLQADTYLKILAIADAYDLARLSDKYYWRRHRPDRFLAHMLNRRGSRYDLLMVKLLTQCLGLYPVGTLAQLDDGRVGIVVRANPANAARPRLFIPDDSGEDVEPQIVDCSELDATGLAFKRSIVKSVASLPGVDVPAALDRKKEYLLSYTL